MNKEERIAEKRAELEKVQKELEGLLASPMSKEHLQARVQYIEDIKYDDKAAHLEEDYLREDFIVWLAERNDEIGERAKIVLSTSKISFDRCCA